MHVCVVNDILFQSGHLVSCTNILFSVLANQHIRHQSKSKMEVILMTADGHNNLPQGFQWVPHHVMLDYFQKAQRTITFDGGGNRDFFCCCCCC